MRISWSVFIVRATLMADVSCAAASGVPGSAWTWKYGMCRRYMWCAFMFAAQNELFWRRPPFGSGSFIDHRTTGMFPRRCANIGGTTPSENVMKCVTSMSGRSFSHCPSSSTASSSRVSMWSGAITSTPGSVLRNAIAFSRAASRVSLVQLTLLSGR